MALSERKKDVVLDIKDDIPNLVVKNHDWPKSLPVEMNRIVISYLFNPSSILEEVKTLDDHFRQLKNETMAPFRDAIESDILPLLSNSTLAQIYQSKSWKSKQKLADEAKELIDYYINDIDHLPLPKQLVLLVNIYDNKEYSHNIEKFRKHLEHIIFKKLDSFICDVITYSYRDSKALAEKKTALNNKEVIGIRHSEQLLQYEQNLLNKNRKRMWWNAGFSVLFLMVGVILDCSIDTSYEYRPLIAILPGLSGIFLIATTFFCLETLTRENRVGYLNTVRNRLFQLGEAKSDNNSLTESLLTPDQQAEYKEDEESNLRPDSPRWGRE